MTGQRTDLLVKTTHADEYLVQRDGSTARQSAYDAALQVAASEALAGVFSGLSYKGTWDPTSGAFPTSTTAGEFWDASAAGTVDGVTFAAEDQVVALVDTASATTYAANWVRRAGRVTKAALDKKAEVIDLSSEASSDGLAYTASSGESLSTLVAGTLFVFSCPVTNTGVATLNIDGTGATSIRDANGAFLYSDMLRAGDTYVMRVTASGQLHLVDVPRELSRHILRANSAIRLARNGADRAGLGTTANNELSLLSWDGTTLAEVARVDSDGKFRVFEGLRIGDTLGGAVEPYTPDDPQLSLIEGITAMTAAKQRDGATLEPRSAEDEAPIILDSAEAWCLSKGDQHRMIVGAHENAFLDVQGMAIGQSQMMRVRDDGSSTLSVYCGPAATWEGQGTSDKTLIWPAGSMVRLFRENFTSFVATPLSGSATTSTAEPPARDFLLPLGGQSLAEQFMRGGGFAGLQQAGISNFYPIDSAVGSTNLLTQWWDVAAHLPRQLTTDLLNSINGVPSTQAGLRVVLFWIKGNGDYLTLADSGLETPALYEQALGELFDYLDANISAQLDIVISPFGAVDNGQNPRGAEAVRRAQVNVASTRAFVHIGPEHRDLDRKAFDPHLTFKGYQQLGARLALHLDNILNGATNWLGPRITNVAELDDYTHEWTLDFGGVTPLLPGATDGFQTLPEDFGLVPNTTIAAVPYTIIKRQWFPGSGSIRYLRTTTKEISTGAIPVYPAGNSKDVRTGHIVSELTKDGRPLRTLGA